MFFEEAKEKQNILGMIYIEYLIKIIGLIILLDFLFKISNKQSYYDAG